MDKQAMMDNSNEKLSNLGLIEVYIIQMLNVHKFALNLIIV